MAGSNSQTTSVLKVINSPLIQVTGLAAVLGVGGYYAYSKVKAKLPGAQLKQGLANAGAKVDAYKKDPAGTAAQVGSTAGNTVIGFAKGVAGSTGIPQALQKGTTNLRNKFGAAQQQYNTNVQNMKDRIALAQKDTSAAWNKGVTKAKSNWGKSTTGFKKMVSNLSKPMFKNKVKSKPKSAKGKSKLSNPFRFGAR